MQRGPCDSPLDQVLSMTAGEPVLLQPAIDIVLGKPNLILSCLDFTFTIRHSVAILARWTQSVQLVSSDVREDLPNLKLRKPSGVERDHHSIFLISIEVCQ